MLLCLFGKHKRKLSATGAAESESTVRQDCSCDSGIQHRPHVARLCSRPALRYKLLFVVGQ
jgi:hypothetical protein